MADLEKKNLAAVITEDVSPIDEKSPSTPFEKETQFGATVTQPPLKPQLLTPSSNSHLKPKTSLDVPSSPVSRVSSNSSLNTPSKPANAFSPFYNHPPCSFEQSSKTSKTKIRIYTHDVESQAALHQQNSSSPKISVERTKDCAMWPSQKELKRRAKADKKRQCECMPKISKRMRIILFVAAFLLVVGLALILGFVISKKVGGGIYVSASNPNKPVR